MTKIDIVSGFLGAGKTTFIRKMLDEVFKGEKVVLIENEFGEVGIDGGFLKDSGIEISEMNQGCICCSLVGDFDKNLREVIDRFTPDRILIEPSGVGKLSDVMTSVTKLEDELSVKLNGLVTVVNAPKALKQMKAFGEFFNNQIEFASTIILSRTQDMDEAKLEDCVKHLQEHNDKAAIITTPWDKIKGEQILKAMEGADTLTSAMKELAEEAHEEHEHHHHHEHGEDCTCGCHDHEHEHEEHEHHHDHHEHEHEHEEHEHHHHHDHEHEHDHHDHGPDCTCGCHDHDHEEHEHEHHEHDHEEHEHHHEHDHEHEEHEYHHHHDHEHGEDCTCGCHDHDHEEHEHHHHHHHHHHADEVFASWGKETPHKFDKATIENAMKVFADSDEYGVIIRSKGMVESTDGTWIYFDFVDGEYELREGEPDYTGRLVVIGAQIDEHKIEELFGL